MKTVVITGINRGLGKELFQLFAMHDYQVFGVLRNERDAQVLEKMLPENAQLILADLAVDDAISVIKQAVGDASVDLLINNAGIGGEAFHLTAAETKEVFDLFNVHCLGVMRTVKALQVNLDRSKNAIVLNVNSRFGSITRQSQGTYSDLQVSYSYRIAKAAQNMLTNCFRNEFKGKIKCISLHPGKLKTQLAQSDADTHPRDIAHKILEYYEGGKFVEEHGIVELGRELIEW